MDSWKDKSVWIGPRSILGNKPVPLRLHFLADRQIVIQLTFQMSAEFQFGGHFH